MEYQQLRQRQPRFTDEDSPPASSSPLYDYTRTMYNGLPYGMQNYLLHVYLSTTIGIMFTLFTANFLSTSVNLIYHIGGGVVIITGFVMAVLCVVCFSFIRPDIMTNEYSINPPARWIFYIGISIGNGMVIAPLIQLVDEISPEVYFTSFLITVIIFGSVSIYTLVVPSKGFLLLGAPLVSGLSTLIWLNIFSGFTALFFGFNRFNVFVHQLDVYGGLILFILYVTYDTYKAIVMFEHHTPDHLGIAVELYLDFVNIFIRILSILMEISLKKKSSSDRRERLY